MSNILFPQITIVGVGLLGGSIGLAVKKQGFAKRIVGVGRNPDRLKKAQQLGAIDSFTISLSEGCGDADLVILGQPIQTIIANLDSVAENAKKGAIVIDLGSTKSSIVKKSQQCFNNGAFFVGCHPMAGSHKSGVEYARADLFSGASCFIVCTDSTSLPALARVVNFWKSLGAKPIIIDPERHDLLVAALSQVPHVVASALSLAASEIPEDNNFISLIAGKGFRDTTRVAQGSPEMWTEICVDNRENICLWIETVIRHLNNIASAVSSGDEVALTNLLADARDFRNCLEQE